MVGTLKDIAVSRRDVFNIDPRLIETKPGWNCRLPSDDNEQHIKSLAASIAQIGVLEPLTVFREKLDNGDFKIYLSDGHCRLRAVMECIQNGVDIKAVPVKTEGKEATEADYILRQALEGKPKTAIELGGVFKRLLAFGWTKEQIAEKSGKGIQSVNLALEYQGAPPEVKKLVESGRVSPTLAAQVVHKEGGTGAATVLNGAVAQATQRGKTRATAQDLVQAPIEVRKSRLTQVAEIIDNAQFIESEEELDEATKKPQAFHDMVLMVLKDSDRVKLMNLLDI